MVSRRALLAGLIAGLALGSPAFAQDDRVTRGVVQQLERQGFDIEDAGRTLLGRVRIVANRSGLRRELVIDPRNGAILRDFVSGHSGSDDDGPDIPDIGDYDDDRADREDRDDDDDDRDDDRDDNDSDSGDDGGDDSGGGDDDD